MVFCICQWATMVPQPIAACVPAWATSSRVPRGGGPPPGLLWVWVFWHVYHVSVCIFMYVHVDWISPWERLMFDTGAAAIKELSQRLVFTLQLLSIHHYLANQPSVPGSFSTLIYVSLCLHCTLSVKMMAATWVQLGVWMFTPWPLGGVKIDSVSLDIVIHYYVFGRSFVSFTVFFSVFSNFNFLFLSDLEESLKNFFKHAILTNSVHTLI